MQSGTPLQSALQAIDSHIPAKASGRDTLIAAKCRGLMRGYDARWKNQEYEVLDVEAFTSGPIINVDTDAQHPIFSAAGKVDIRARLGGVIGIIDHKTTSDDIESPDSPYWLQLAIESQASHYLLLEHLNERKYGWAHWDAIKKPGISPREVTNANLDILAVEGKYFDSPASASDIKWAKDIIQLNAVIAERKALYAAACKSAKKTGSIPPAKPEIEETATTESMSLYEMRLAHDCAIERPGYYFQRRAVSRLQGDLAEYAVDQWNTAEEMRESRDADRWGRNSKACMQYGSPCKYLGVCSNNDAFEFGGWRRKTQVHTELPVLNSDNGGRSVLTNSCMGTYRLCRRKYFYDYEQGWEKMQEEEREALFFGTAMHVALEAWWLGMRDKTTAVDSFYPL